MTDFVTFLGRKVEKSSFRAFVFARNGDKKLARTWDEFLALTATGEWFADMTEIPAKAPRKRRKTSDDAGT